MTRRKREIGNSSRRQFDDERDLTPRRRNINTAGKTFHPGEPIDRECTTLQTRALWYRTGRVVYLDEFNPIQTKQSDETEGLSVDVDALSAEELAELLEMHGLDEVEFADEAAQREGLKKVMFINIDIQDENLIDDEAAKAMLVVGEDGSVTAAQDAEKAILIEQIRSRGGTVNGRLGINKIAAVLAELVLTGKSGSEEE